MDSVSYITLETLQHSPPKLAFWGALFSVGAALVGGLLSKPKKPTPAPAPQVVKVVETKQTPNIQEGVDAAKKAGFNPASAARMGLIQGFITNETPFLTTNPQYVNWEANNNYQQQKSSWMGNMFSSVGSAAQQWGSFKQNQQRLDMQSRLIDSEIYRNYSTGRQNYFKPAQWSGAQTEWHHAKNKSPVPIVSDPSGNQIFPSGDIYSTNVLGLQNFDYTNPDTENVEQVYGELAAELWGISKMGRDVARHYGGPKYGQYGDGTGRPNYYFIDNNNRVYRDGVSQTRALTQSGNPLSMSSGSGW